MELFGSFGEVKDRVVFSHSDVSRNFMNDMKGILIFLVFFCLTLKTFAQEGFKVIYKAEVKYENGQHERALKLLTKAENMNYGFCGNAWMDANRAINLLRAKIYIDNKEYQMARNSLDSINWEYLEDNLDSIRIRTYQMEYGKDSLSSMIDASLVNTNVECGESDCYVIIPLTNGKLIRMKFCLFNSNLMYIADASKKKEMWVTWFKETENYKLIKEKS